MKQKLALFLSLTLFFTTNFLSFSQTYIVNDTFETDVLDTLPDGWFIRSNGSGVENQIVVDSPIKNGIQSLQLEGSSGTFGSVGKTISNLPDKLTIETWIYADDNLNGNDGSISIGTNSEATGVSFYQSNIVVSYYPGGSIQILQPFVANTWYHIKMETDLANRTYEVYINNILASSNSVSTFQMHTGSDTQVMLNASNEGTMKMFFDDVKVYQTNQDLVAHYPFNGNANDESGNGNHGTPNGATLTTDRFGNTDSAYHFNGVSDNITCLSPGPIGESPRTISFWAKTDEVPYGTWDNAVISYGSNDAYGERFELNINSRSRGLGVDINGAALTKDFDNSDNDWHFYTAVFEGGTNKTMYDVKLYTNGTLLTTITYDNSNTSVLNTSSEQPIHIGSMFNTHRFFNGSIDDIKIYNYALTDEQINAEANNLAAHYPFNGNTNDESGNYNHGTPNGATLTTDRFGNTDSAYSFDGSTNYISIPDNPNINIQAGESYSISFWVQHNAQNNGKYMISKYMGSIGVQPSYALGTGSNGDSYSWYEYTAGNGIENRGNIDLNDNEWHHITSVFKSGESVSIYVDGVLDIQHATTHSGSISNVTDLTIGCGANIAQFYNGKIDDIKIYKKALTEDEIKNEANNLVAYYPFNGNANDESGNNHNGTVIGPTLTEDRFGNANSAYYYNGANNNIDIGDWENGGPMSFNLWVRWDSFNNWGLIMDLALGRNNNNIYIGNQGTSNIFMFHTLDGATKYLFYCDDTTTYPNSPLTLNSWTMITCTVDETGLMKAYKNAELIGTFNGFTPTKMVRTNQYFGSANYPENGYFNGALDDIRIYSSVISEVDILNLYNNNSLDIEDDQMLQGINFYVNNNKLYLNKNQNLSKIKSISIYNLLAQNVFQTNNIQTKTSLHFLNQGIYILKVENTNGNTITKKFIIK